MHLDVPGTRHGTDVHFQCLRDHRPNNEYAGCNFIIRQIINILSRQGVINVVTFFFATFQANADKYLSSTRRAGTVVEFRNITAPAGHGRNSGMSLFLLEWSRQKWLLSVHRGSVRSAI